MEKGVLNERKNKFQGNALGHNNNNSFDNGYMGKVKFLKIYFFICFGENFFLKFFKKIFFLKFFFNRDFKL